MYTFNEHKPDIEFETRMNKTNIFPCITILLMMVTVPIRSSAQPPGLKVAPNSVIYTEENCINTFTMDKIEPTDAGYQYWFADTSLADGKTLKLSVVRPHLSTHPPHTHSEDEFFFVLSGKAEFYLKVKWIPAEPNTSCYCPSNEEHGIRNAGDTELRYLVIKKYEKK